MKTNVKCQMFPPQRDPANGGTNVKSNEGFTLVELLASVIVLVAVGSIIAGIVVSSLRGTNKTNTIESIRQNGDYALNQISKDIEYALPFDGQNTGLSNDNGVTYDIICKGSLNPTPTPITPYNLITVQSAVQSTNNAITKYNCSGSTSSTAVLSTNGASLVDANSVTLQNCSFNCIQNKPTDIPIIKISFSLGSKTSNSPVLVENSSPPIVFETSITMRNYKR